MTTESTESTISFAVSGTAMSGIEGSEIYHDPKKYDDDSQGARDAYAALRGAKARRVGKGVSYTVTTTEAGAETIKEFCLDVGSGFVSGGTDAETRAEGRALLAVADRIQNLLAGRS